MKKLALAGLLILVSLASAGSCLADPSSDFYERNGDVYDNWELCRTRSWGDDGFFRVTDSTFRPAIAFESIGGLGELKHKAWEVGEELAEQYSGNELAEQIFAYARDHVTYTSDAIQFGYDEFARNADEMIEDIQSTGSSRGDCEDYAVLLAVMFKAAGIPSAVVLAPEHAAALVYLPDYPDANTSWSLDGESGWIWAEATGRTNPLGWTPSKFMRSDLAVYEIGEEDIFAAGASEGSAPSGGGGVFFGGSSFFSFILFFWILSAFRRR
ncbi:hypothetical protein ES706_00510 [subsurface metagenome]|nr:hypothetical protein [Hadesarchaea archaeon]